MGRDRMNIDLTELAALPDKVAQLEEQLAALSEKREPSYYSLEQVAEMRACSVRTIRRRTSEGALPFKRIGGEIMIAREEVLWGCLIICGVRDRKSVG